jgi:hypothetical protein
VLPRLAITRGRPVAARLAVGSRRRGIAAGRPVPARWRRHVAVAARWRRLPARLAVAISARRPIAEPARLLRLTSTRLTSLSRLAVIRLTVLSWLAATRLTVLSWLAATRLTGLSRLTGGGTRPSALAEARAVRALEHRGDGFAGSGFAGSALGRVALGRAAYWLVALGRAAHRRGASQRAAPKRPAGVPRGRVRRGPTAGVIPRVVLGRVVTPSPGRENGHRAAGLGVADLVICWRTAGRGLLAARVSRRGPGAAESRLLVRAALLVLHLHHLRPVPA